MAQTNDDFVANQLSFDQDAIPSASAPTGSTSGDAAGAVDGEMMMTLSRAAEKADKVERKRKREEKKQAKERKKVENALTRLADSAAGMGGTGGDDELLIDDDEHTIDPELLDGIEDVPGPSGGKDIVEGEMDKVGEGSTEGPVKKRKKRVSRKSKSKATPNDSGINPDDEAVESKSNVNEFGVATNSFARDRKKHAVTEDELRTMFVQPGAMHAYLSERWMTTQELKRLEDAGIISYKKGKFSDEEASAIKAAVSYFQNANKLTESEASDVLMAKGSTAASYPGLWNEIASSVPGRPVRFVQKYVKRLYDTRGRKGKWSEQEDADLMHAFESTGGSWVKIALTVDRSEEDCRARWRDVLRSKTERDAGRWTKAEEIQLLKAIKEANIAMGKDELARDPPWEVVNRKMDGKRSQMQCRKKWHTQMRPTLLGEKGDPDMYGQEYLGSPGASGNLDDPITPSRTRRNVVGKMRADKKELIKQIRTLAPSTISSIDWETLADTHFPGMGATVLSKMFKKMMGKTQATLSTPLSDVLDLIEENDKIEMSVHNDVPIYKSPDLVPENADD